MWYLACGLVVAGAVGMRAWVHMGFEIPRTVDAAYYPVQARWLIEEGRLMLRDLPLKFALDAALARVLMALGLGTDAAVLQASRWLDILVPPLAAVPVFVLARRWSRRGWAAVAGGLAGGMVAVLQAPALRMTAEFEKNALGLVWMAALSCSLHGAMRRGGAVRWLSCLAWLMLAALTHVGVAGACVVLGIASFAAWRLWERRPVVRVLGASVGIAVVSAGVVLGAMRLADPGRAVELAQAPSKLLRSDARPGPGGPAMPRTPPGWRPPGGRGGPGGPGGRFGGPDGWSALWPMVIGCASAVMGIVALVVRRKSVQSSDAAVVIGASITALVLALPLLGAETSQRLMLMAPLPAAVVIAWILAGSRRLPALTTVASVCVVGLCVGPLAVGRHGPPMPTLSHEELRELESLRGEVPPGRRTLVMARHGLEFWAAYFLHTPARNGEIPGDAAARYDNVFVLREKREALGPPRMRVAVHASGAGAEDDEWIEFHGGPPRVESDDLEEGPGGGLGFPPGPDGFPGLPPGVPPGGRGGPMGPTPLPDNAELVSEGEYFLLYRVPMER